MRRAVLALMVSAAVSSATAGARADAVEDARRAYDQGAQAYDAADFALAMRQFARADDLAPNPVALELALKSALKMNDAVMGMTLVERAERRTPAGSLAAVIAQARQRFEPSVGRLFVQCPPRHACRATLDGSPLAVGIAGWVTTGDHALDAWVDETNARETVRVDPGVTAQRTLTAKEPAASPVTARDAAPSPARVPAGESTSRGVSPVWFWAGAGLTAALAGAAVVSGLDVNAKHDDFTAHPNADTQNAGVTARTRTNVLAGASAVAGLVTAGVGLFGVRWGAPAPPSTGAALPAAAGARSYATSGAPSFEVAIGDASLWLRGHY